MASIREAGMKSALTDRLQRLLVSSRAAKCLAVRRVTLDNQGKKTAGVDGVKSLTPEQRLELVGQIEISNKARPTRRVWIPKPGRNEKRPLGIPTMHDRATQGLLKIALEPEWEAYMEGNSYGFRPGRGCHGTQETSRKSCLSDVLCALDVPRMHGETRGTS